MAHPRCVGRCLILIACAALLSAFRPAADPPAVLALDNGLALTPYMGWNSFYGQTPLYEEVVLNVANTMGSRGLLAAGYQYVWLDATWWDGTRDSRGYIVAPVQQWPHGLRFLTDYVHARGLRAGIYTDAGADGCAGPDQGSGPAAPGGADHYQQDVDQFAAWGFDAVKVDFCGGRAAGLDPATQYQAFGNALLHNASHRPLLYNVCNPFTPQPGDGSAASPAYWSYTFAPPIANSWRTADDIALPGRAHEMRWADMLNNLNSDAAHPDAAGPGHWNDPDYLGPELGMSRVEDQTQLTMWAMLAAPLVIGSDVRNLSDASIAMLTNPEVIGIDQDALGRQAVKLSSSSGIEVWVKQLSTPGTWAVALLNLNAETRDIPVVWAGLGLAGSASVRDLWAHVELGTYPTGFTGEVQGHGAVLLLVRRGR